MIPLPTKACPVVLRDAHGTTQILAFRHPLAGSQLVKGGIEVGESADDAALRELAEEAGITAARVVRSLGVKGCAGTSWSFSLVEADGVLPDAWVHRAPDDGGLDLAFFWQPLHASLDETWHASFRDAMDFLRNSLPDRTPTRG